MAPSPTTSGAPAASPAAADRRPDGVPWRDLFSLHALLDAEGRPLGEHRAPRDLPGAAPTQRKRCHYAGSRWNHALPMNASALRQTSRHWDEVVAGIAWLQRASRGSSPGPSPGLTLAQLWRLLATVAALPGYLLHRAPAPERWRPPGALAAIYKASLGVKFMLESHLVRELLAGRALDRPADDEALSALAEESGVLIGVEEVCAAPANMIRDALRAFIHGGEPRAAAASPLAEVLGDWPPLLAFARAAHDLYAALLAFSTLSARTRLALEKAWGGRPPRGLPHDLPHDLPHGLPHDLPHGLPHGLPPPAEGSPLEVRMSVTLGMRRVRGALAALDDARCAETLQALCRATSGEEGGGDPATALLAARGGDAAARSQERLARALEEELARACGGALAPGPAALLARQFQLDNAAAARVGRAQRLLNDALGRGPADRSDGPALADYCAVSPWSVATAFLGVPVSHEPGAAEVRCAGARVSAGAPVDAPGAGLPVMDGR
jgi:hypothetical protein